MSTQLEMQVTPTGHTLQVEDDLLVVEIRGDITALDADVLTAAYEDLLRRHGYLLLLIGLDGAASASTEARRKMVNWAKQHSAQISAAGYGGSAVVRIFMNLMNGATRLLSGKPTALAFFASEPEARQLLARERQRLQHQRSA